MGKLSSATISQRDNSPSNIASFFSAQATRNTYPLPERLMLLSFFPSEFDVQSSALCASARLDVQDARLIPTLLTRPSIFHRVLTASFALPAQTFDYPHADLTIQYPQRSCHQGLRRS